MAVSAYQRFVDARDELRKQLDVALPEQLTQDREPAAASRSRRAAVPPQVRNARRRLDTATARLAPGRTP
ncbi:hypothetical protein OHA21_19475 [Actinoplanes sp. NBC_00393]|uniref:hypothetical protein n=1 Tax=Actinoplanes sp. NBC_00393 TaxID=2975953 RepID=UPI002E2114E0